MSAATSIRLASALFLVGFGISVSAEERPPAPLKPVADRILPSLGGLGGMEVVEEQPEPHVTIQVATPVSVKAAKTWVKLGQSLSFNFPEETPLVDLLKFVKLATANEEKKENGLPIYVDPVSLQESDKTINSPVTLELEDIPISVGLTLALRQLGLKFYVDAQGIVMIVGDNEEEHQVDPSARILEEMTMMRGQLQLIRNAHHPMEPDPATRGLAREIAALKEQVAELQGMIKGLTERAPAPRATAPGTR